MKWNISKSLIILFKCFFNFKYFNFFSCFRKQPVAKYREYQKKRKLAKQQRFKQLEEEREVEKNKWLAFATKVRPILFTVIIDIRYYLIWFNINTTIFIFYISAKFNILGPKV